MITKGKKKVKVTFLVTTTRFNNFIQEAIHESVHRRDKSLSHNDRRNSQKKIEKLKLENPFSILENTVSTSAEESSNEEETTIDYTSSEKKSLNSQTESVENTGSDEDSQTESNESTMA